MPSPGFDKRCQKVGKNFPKSGNLAPVFICKPWCNHPIFQRRKNFGSEDSTFMQSLIIENTTPFRTLFLSQYTIRLTVFF